MEIGTRKSYFNMGRPKTYTYNEKYFEIPSINNCYWVGFIAADGCIYEQKRHSAILAIRLTTNDKLHLENFKKDIEFTGPIHDIVTKPSHFSHLKENYYHSQLRISSSKICDDLKTNFNITSYKSLSLQPPSLYNREEILSYIIGYIDGDGHVSQKFSITVTGTKEILEWINCQFNMTGNLYKEQRSTNNTWYLNFNTKTLIAQECKNHILKFNLPILDRKWNK